MQSARRLGDRLSMRAFSFWGADPPAGRSPGGAKEMGVLSTRRCQAGFTLLELMVAVVVIVVAFFGLLLSLHYGSVLNETSRQLRTAHEAAQRALEAVRAYEFAFIYRSFNADTNDDPNGPGTAEWNLSPLKDEFDRESGGVTLPKLTALGDNIGNNFVVDGLEPRATDPDGVVGVILFPEVADAGNTVLSEQGQATPPFDMFGPPRDLNENGSVNDLNVSDDYKRLPVAVLVQWQGSFDDEREVRMDTVLHAKLR